MADHIDELVRRSLVALTSEADERRFRGCQPMSQADMSRLVIHTALGLPNPFVRQHAPAAMPRKEGETVPAENFCATLAANVDNEKLDDAGFRQLVRNSLPIVDFPRPEERQAAHAHG